MAATVQSKSFEKSLYRKKSHKADRYNDKHSSGKRKKESHHMKQDKFKTLSQLAKLVQNGKLKIPSSLVEYVDDHASLIDQLFTILTIDDIEGMLPDILKGIKLKKVKHLCFMQLQKLSQDELRKIITQTEEEEQESAERRKMDMFTSDESGDCEETPVVVADISNDERSEENSLSQMEDIASEDQVEIEVNAEMSDFDDLMIGRGHKREANGGYLKEKGTESLVREENHFSSEQENSKKMEVVEEMESESASLEEEGGEMVGRWREDVPEDARVMEVRLREKLLEAQLKRLEERDRKSKTKKGSGCDSEDQDAGLTCEEEEEPGELVELDLRQRALESLLAKRRKKMSES